LNQFNSELPKGMSFPEAPETKKPVPLNLGCGNYVAAIRQALSILPVEICIDKCIIVERAGRCPEVRLTLTVLGEKGGSGEWR